MTRSLSPDARILMTGVTGMVGLPLAKALAAAGHEVTGIARFTNPDVRAQLEAAGVRTVTADLGSGDLDTVPTDIDHVLHFAVSKSNDYDVDLTANVDGTIALMERCRSAKSFLHCSSAAVYSPAAPRPFTESSDLGDSHGAMGMRTYSISKIAAEAAARYGARRFGLPTTIARLNVPYGDTFGWPAVHVLFFMANDAPVPVHADAPGLYNLLHLDDMVGTIPALLAAASVPAATVNWASPEEVSIEEWCGHIGELIGKSPTFAPTQHHVPGVSLDLSRLDGLGVKTTVSWRDGMRRMVETSFPHLLV